jgi:hypothetical protein
MEAVKVCFKCGQPKPLSEFYKHAQMADGHLNKCKACAKADVLEHRQANLEKVRAYDRERSKLPHRVAAATAVTKAWRKKHPGRSAAQTKAIRRHRKAPMCCQMCGLSKRLERHHPDYDLPLLVVWLCKPCHVIADETRRQND